MESIKENLNTLGGRLRHARVRLGLSQSELARRTGVKQPSINQLEKGGTKNTVYSATLASALRVRALWLERGIGPMEIDDKPIRDESDSFYIPQYDAGGSMGNGLILAQSVGTIRSFFVSSEWLRENLSGRKNTNDICVVTGFGDSMEPLFKSGDPLLVDLSVKEFIGDFPYFFRIGEEGFIKRLQRIPGEGYRAISENKNYESWTIKPDMDFVILGKVIKTWYSTDF